MSVRITPAPEIVPEIQAGGTIAESTRPALPVPPVEPEPARELVLDEANLVPAAPAVLKADGRFVQRLADRQLHERYISADVMQKVRVFRLDDGRVAIQLELDDSVEIDETSEREPQDVPEARTQAKSKKCSASRKTKA